jgi:hypothetical protein
VNVSEVDRDEVVDLPVKAVPFTFLALARERPSRGASGKLVNTASALFDQGCIRVPPTPPPSTVAQG